MTAEQVLVEQLASKSERLGAMRRLLGAVSARELRHVKMSDAAFGALVDGLSHANSQVRFWCVQLLDHCPSPEAIASIAPLLDDPVPRVRRNAVHALGCQACKPAWDGRLDEPLVAKIAAMAADDANAKVRAEAATALACHRPETRHRAVPGR